ncbi:MAG: alpha/beta hydrolase family protein [Planctomycetota bacterium]|jgi:dipeptidyl aminopeptidase/acylaminoacyl peptidase
MDYLSYLSNSAPFEKFIKIKNQRQNIAATLFLPDSDIAVYPAVIIAHGFTGSRNADARMLVWAGRALAHNGIAALSLDFRGSGESEGCFSEMTIDSEISDAVAALDFLSARDDIKKDAIGMIGHSMGGFVSSCTAGRDKRIKSLSLWAALYDVSIFQQRLSLMDESGAKYNGFYDVGGLLISSALYESAVKADIEASVRAGCCSCQIIHGSEDETVTVEGNAEKYYSLLTSLSRKVEKIILNGAGHCFNSVPWRIDLIKNTVEWFKKELYR